MGRRLAWGLLLSAGCTFSPAITSGGFSCGWDGGAGGSPDAGCPPGFVCRIDLGYLCYPSSQYQTGCGSSGTCTPGTTCVDGTCVCNATSCNGCCAGGKCQAPTDATECGAGGSSCVNCGSGADRCQEDGGCACGDRKPCGPGSVCLDGQCVCPMSCAGCCQDGGCVDAVDIDHCGVTAQVCYSCASAQANGCANGMCSCAGGPACGPSQKCDPTAGCLCDPTHCDGCCGNGTADRACHASSAMTCGTAGATCQTCDPVRTSGCTGGQCLCGDGGACGPSLHCVGNQCLCDIVSCSGGCCQGNDCIIPPNAVACGAAGEACQMCPGGETCISGACSGCAANCKGCCSGPTCNIPGISTCGLGGVVCQDCSAERSDSCRDDGSCGCGGQPICAAGQHCVSQQCVCDPTSCATGCCLNNVCQPAANFPNCGGGGQQCNVCDPNRSHVCDSMGNCACGTGSQCGPGQRCDNGTCVCDSNACGALGRCCAMNACVAISTSSCSLPGGACSACDLTADGCTAGQCTCGGGGACDPGQHCVNGHCTCDPQSCGTGCCDATNHCQAGNTKQYCGLGAVACLPCPGLQTCDGGSCSGCNPTTCPSGCCSGSNCAAIGAAACGPLGGVCSNCGAIGDGCNALGVCTCGGGQKCAAGQACVDGGCTCNSASCLTGCCQGANCENIGAATCGLVGGTCSQCGSLADGCSASGQCTCGSQLECEPGQICQNKQCVCNPMSCPLGCCTASGACVNPGTVGECGSGGALCNICSTLTANTCLNGLCSCGDGGVCPSGSECTNGVCQCDSNSCPTGCCSGLTCLTQETSTSCGSNGQACRACANGATCQNGVCEDCAQTCSSGCCVGSTCISPPDAGLCGTGGSACTSCGLTGDGCSPTTGLCTCGGNAPCAPGLECSNGVCICDANSCAGCCQIGLCVNPTDAGLCGANGSTCGSCGPNANACGADGGCFCGAAAACGPGLACVGGACQCTPTSCAGGCCAGATVCVSSTSGSQCGANGSACQSCGAVGNNCASDGGCYCGVGGGPCGPGTECVTGACTCDANSCPTGCCNLGICIDPPDAGLCGANGAACGDCGAGADLCGPDGGCFCDLTPACTEPTPTCMPGVGCM